MIGMIIKTFYSFCFYYRQVYQGPYSRIDKLRGYSSDGDSDEE